MAHLSDSQSPCGHDSELVDGLSSGELTDAIDQDSEARRDHTAALEVELAQLKEAVGSQRQIGVALGLLAQRYGCNLDQAWKLLTRVSQNTNIKVRDLSVVLADSFNAEPHTGGSGLPEEIARFLPGFGRAG